MLKMKIKKKEISGNYLRKMNRKAIIISLSGTTLSKKESILISKEKPWGVILFKRNINNFNQVKNLIKNIRKIIKDKKYPILIDEEGGTVSRLSNFINNRDFSQNFFGSIYNKDKQIALKIYKNYIILICQIFKKIGININTVPVLDVPYKNTHKILQTRTYSHNRNIIKNLGAFCIKIYRSQKVSTVVKHIPGHGCAAADSHKSLPVVNKKLSELNKNDFNCFKGISSHFAMTAHILYKKIDSKNPATHSSKIIKQIIRNKIGFKGILISDDISMKALKYGLIKNATKSLESGCNLVLYCAGKNQDLSKLLKNIPLIDKFTAKKTSEFYNFLS